MENSSFQIDPARLPELYEAVCQVYASLESSTVIKQIMAGSIKLTKAEQAFIELRISSNYSEFDMCSASSLASDSSPSRTRGLRSWAGEPEKIVQGILVKDTEDDPLYIPEPLTAQFRSQTMLVVPLRTSGEFLGLLGVSRAASTGKFTANDLAVLESLSAQAAIAILHAHRYSSLVTFIPSMTSEFRMPLFSIKGFTDLLIKETAGSLTGEQREFLGIVLLNVKKLIHLLDELLAISRIEGRYTHLETEPVELRGYIEQAISNSQDIIQQKLLTVTVQVTDIPLIQANSYGLGYVINSLIDNATRYTPSTGEIEIAAEVQGSGIKTIVQDTGIGIKLKDKSRIFQKWFRADEPLVRGHPGYGLSLYIAKNLIELMGGTIGFESEPDHGSTIWFTLPIATPDLSPNS